MIKARDSLLQLCVENAAVGNDDNARKYGLVIIAEKGSKAVGCPRYRVGFARARAVLYQIIAPRAVFAHVGNQFADNIELMKAREDQRLFLCDLLLTVREQLFIFGDFKADELLHDVNHAVLSENALPQVRGRVAFGVGRVALSAVSACAVRALIEGQEICVLARELCRHADVHMIDAEECKHAGIEAETYLPRVAVKAPLALGVGYILPRVLVFQFESENGYAIDRYHHIHRLFAVGGIVPLAVEGDLVGGVLFEGGGVESRFGLEIAHAEGYPPVFEAVSQHRKHAVHIAGV